MTATLIVSVSIAGSESDLGACSEFGTQLDARLVPASWLLPPRPAGGWHHPDSPVIGWLRSRVQIGDALVLHGFNHSVVPAGTRLGRRAEFAVLPSHEATLRIIAATRTMEHLGLPSDVFAPPRWLASSGTLVALRKRGFRVCADGAGVRLLDGSDRMLRGRVLTSAGSLAALPDNADAWRQRSQTASLIRTAVRTARRGGLVRIAADAAELTNPATRRVLLATIDAALAEGALPATYRLPIPDPAPLSA
ncbi:DUF2334 domain-containing protein [Pseudonocardia spinosispora]|uniref:DUF2334 domain-containing protein n=1 Tax=Pseudonocardia spinosispora TaxID=103441 RepID=UPI00040704D0|nr:DUF2334 domain-containing protein [Pseudonocardia spinosispora]